MEVDWYVRRGADTIGPLSADQISKEIGAGNIQSDAFVCPVGGASWCPITAVAEFAAVFTNLSGRSCEPSAAEKAEGRPEEWPAVRDLGSYRIVRRIGGGGMGEVYEAFHIRLHKRVALKTLRGSMAERPDARARFLREAETAASLRHPHIVDVTDVGEDSGVPFLVMELLVGETLSELVHRSGALSVETAVDLLLPVLDAVATAHDHNIIHRDLKPENIFLVRSRHGAEIPKVLDFGISKVLSDENRPNLTATASLLGTPFYMSPEQAKGAKLSDARSDQYSLGVVLYEALTARQPYASNGDSFIRLARAIAEGDFPPPRAIRADLSPELEAIILKAMSVSPAERFESVRAFGAALLQFASSGARATWAPAFGAPGTLVPHAPNPPVPTTLERGGTAVTAGKTGAGERKSRAGFLGLGLLLLVGGVGSLLAWRLGGDPPPNADASSGSASTGDTLPDSASQEPIRIQVSVEPSTARIVLDGRVLGEGSIEAELPRDDQEHALLFTADGFISKTVIFREPPPRMTATLDRVPPAPPTVAPPVVTRPPQSGREIKTKTPGPKATSQENIATPSGPEATSKPTAAPAPAAFKTDNIDPWE